MFGRGEPLVSKLAIISEYIIFPGAMFVALIYSLKNDPIKRARATTPWEGGGKRWEEEKEN